MMEFKYCFHTIKMIIPFCHYEPLCHRMISTIVRKKVQITDGKKIEKIHEEKKIFKKDFIETNII